MSEGQVPITQLSIQDLGSLKQNFENVSLTQVPHTSPLGRRSFLFCFFVFFSFDYILLDKWRT